VSSPKIRIDARPFGVAYRERLPLFQGGEHEGHHAGGDSDRSDSGRHGSVADAGSPRTTPTVGRGSDGGPILIIGDVGDLHVRRVLESLAATNRLVVLFDRHTLAHSVTLEPGNPPRASVRTAAGTVALTDVAAVWLRERRLHVIPSLLDARADEEFVSAEWRMVLQSLPWFTPSARWVNAMHAQVSMLSKPYQLCLATTVGFDIPMTAITNDPAEGAGLARRAGHSVYKTLSGHIFAPDGYIYTSIVTGDAIERAGLSVRRAPCIFQQLVPKTRELRITVVGDRLFTAVLDSRQDGSTMLDWRRAPHAVRYTVGHPDHDLLEKVLAFHRAADLTYAAYDFIITPDGRPVFLDCNPAGQWAWIEQATGLPIAAAVADELLRTVAQP